MWTIRSGLVTGVSAAKTMCMVIAGAAQAFEILRLSVSSKTAVGFLVELVESTQAGAGTSSAHTFKQYRDFKAGDTTAPAQITGATNYTVEPTTLTVLDEWYLAAGGIFLLQEPDREGPASLLSGSTKYKALGLRVTPAASVDLYASMKFRSTI